MLPWWVEGEGNEAQKGDGEHAGAVCNVVSKSSSSSSGSSADGTDGKDFDSRSFQ